MSSTNRSDPQDIGVSSKIDHKRGGSKTLHIEALAAGGRGISREEGAVWFVQGAIPGDRVEATIVRSKARFHEAETTRILEPSPDRREPPCPFQSQCGGCPWMPLPETEQRTWKRRLIVDALTRIAGLSDPSVAEMVAVGEPFGYRSRIELTLGQDRNGKVVLGYRSARSYPVADPESTDRTSPHAVVDIDRCLLADPAIARVLPLVREIVLDPTGSIYREVGERGRVFRIHLRSGHEGVLVALVDDHEAFPDAGRVARLLIESSARISGVVRLTFPHRGRGGVRMATLAGDEFVNETVGGKTVRLPATSFSQVHAAVAEAMTETILEFAGPLEGVRIWDLYGGVGRYAAAAIRQGAKAAVVCEADPDAVAAGRKRALPGLTFVAATVERFFREHADRYRAPDRIIANPPRAGLGKSVVQGLLQSGTERLIVVSCDPATLARDLRALTETGQFAVDRVVPYDLFPQTAHVEAIALLRRQL